MYDLISRFHRLDIAFNCDGHHWMKLNKMNPLSFENSIVPNANFTMFQRPCLNDLE